MNTRLVRQSIYNFQIGCFILIRSLRGCRNHHDCQKRGKTQEKTQMSFFEVSEFGSAQFTSVVDVNCLKKNISNRKSIDYK